jgi:hypothetical protein
MVVARRAADFELPSLAGQGIAVWPSTRATFAPTASNGLAEAYGTQDAFLDALDRSFSARLILRGQARSLRSDEVSILLGGAEATRLLLDPSHLLGDPDGRFSAPPSGLATLAEVPELKGLSFAVVFRDLALVRAERVSGIGACVSATLRLAVVDLGAKAVVWEGTLESFAPLGQEGLRDLVDDLSAQFAEQVYKRKLRRRREPEPPFPCGATADCIKGICISGGCR